MNTYCPELWNGFTINKKGDVFVCCHYKPRRIGNIYNETLEAMANSSNIIAFRQASLNGSLACYDSCNLIKKNLYPPPEINSLVVDYQRMTKLHLDFGDPCNIACVMCRSQIKRSRKSTILDPKALIDNADIRPFETIVVQGGEPLFIPQCLAYINYLADMKKRYNLLTNGLLIDDDMANQLARDAKVVTISINAATKETHEKVNRGSDFNAVICNIRRLIRAREMLCSDLVICGRMTITERALHEIPIFLGVFREMGFDEINFGYDRTTVPMHLKIDSDLKTRLRKEIVRVAKSIDCKKVDFLRLEQLELYP